MNDNENLNTSLMNENDISISKRGKLYVIKIKAVAFISSAVVFVARIKMNYYINKWRKYLSKETDSKTKQNDPFRILTNLWAHKNVIRDLEQIRLNPNLLNLKHIRNDLEFYIPQLCSFMLFGEYETVEEFLAFLCKACFASFSFAHRIVWFLKSLMNPYNPYNEKIRTILHLIQTIFKSESKLDSLERLHVAGSKKYLEIQKDDPENNLYILKRKAIRQKLDEFIDRQYNEALEQMGISKQESLTLGKLVQTNITKIETEDIYINTFKRYDSVTNDENNILTQYVKQIDMDDVNLSSFLSNINFIDHICNICEILRSTALTDQNKTLLSELRKTNKILPANVYLPFLKDSIRNYVIASIPLSEVKIYKTKNRAPYAITLECFRLDELTYNLMNNKEKAVSSSSSNEEDENHNSEGGAKDYKIKIKNKKVNKNKNKKEITNDFNLQRSQSFKDSLLISNIEKVPNKNEHHNLNKSDDNNIEKLNNNSKRSDFDFYTEIKDKKTKSFLEPSNILKTSRDDYKRHSIDDTRYKLSKLNYLLESDVNISKPLVIKNILNANMIKEEVKSASKKKEKFQYQDLNYETDPADYKKIEKVVKSNVNKENKNNISLNLSDEITEKFEKEKNNLIEKSTTVKLKHEKTNLKDYDDERNLSQEDNNEHTQTENIVLTLSNKIDSDVYSIFGEKIEEQTERLKKKSPFGMLNTYKLFKIIVKSGEDLRQEQFATQLINEFYQIFKMEKVDCWVNPYEILATGNNVGIIEVVPNAVSLDQLKRHSKQVTSLKNFYETYYAPINSDSYKKAMKNFISSLAGYSLVCYFLQIKDRHNANILIDDQGHVIHIDFGFMLSNAPGKGIQFEKAPFKLTKEFVDVMGGVNSTYFNKFRKLLWKGFIAIINHYEKILILVEMMYCGHGNKLPCFEKGQTAIEELRSRFIPKPNMKTRDYMRHVDTLIEQSIDNWRTKWYDKYQYFVQGIFY